MRKILMTTMLAVALSATAVLAQPHARMGGHMGGGMGPDPGMLFPMILGKLDLTPDQQTRVHAILDAHRPAMQALFPQLRAAHQSLATKLFQADPLTADDLTPYVSQMNTLKGQVVQEGIKVALEIRGVLTPAQLSKAADIHAQLESLHAQMKALLGDQDGPPPLP